MSEKIISIEKEDDWDAAKNEILFAHQEAINMGASEEDLEKITIILEKFESGELSPDEAAAAAWAIADGNSKNLTILEEGAA
jgi:hypothetical protein